MTGKIFLIRIFFFLPTDPGKSWKVTGNDNIILSRLINKGHMALSESCQQILERMEGIQKGIVSDHRSTVM